MDLLLHRYRNVTVLVLVLAAQLFLLGYQVKSREDVESIRSWAVTGLMPISRILDILHDNTIGIVADYAQLTRVKQQNDRLQRELGRLRLENQTLRTELSTADRARILALFPTRNPSKTLAAHVTGRSPGNSKGVFVDRGVADGVQKNMAVITPYGIVGRVTAAYQNFSQVVLITDSNFAAGVISGKNRVHGSVKGQGHGICYVEHIPNDEKLEPGEWFYTSGDDRIFPKGLPVGQVRIARQGKMFFQEVHVAPSGLQHGLEEVMIVLEGVHQQLPDPNLAQQPILLPPPPPGATADVEAQRVIRGGVVSTDADQVIDRYRRIGAAQGHAYGAGGGVPNFNAEPPPPVRPVVPAPRPADPPATTAPPASAPSAPANPEPQP